MRVLPALLLILSLLLPCHAPAFVYGTGDWGGGDLILQDGDEVWGILSGIGRFVVPEGATVTVSKYDPLAPFYFRKGRVEVYAQEIEIRGTLTALGSGSGIVGYLGAPYVIWPTPRHEDFNENRVVHTGVVDGAISLTANRHLTIHGTGLVEGYQILAESRASQGLKLLGSGTIRTDEGPQYYGIVKLFDPVGPQREETFSLETGQVIECTSWLSKWFWAGRDWGGADFRPTGEDVVWGHHRNIGTFEIPPRASVSVLPYDGVTTDTGMVFVEAEHIVIEGSLDASLRGYSGGAGGAGHGFDYLLDGYLCDRIAYNTSDGMNGEGVYVGHSSLGTQGVHGDGAFAGTKDAPEGGYLGYQINGDSTQNMVVHLGSGGAGQDGSRGQEGGDFIAGCSEVEGGDGGRGGGQGGGSISLAAGNTLAVKSRIIASGGRRGKQLGIKFSETSIWFRTGASGGSPLPPADPDMPFVEFVSNGAGGGILLVCDTPGGLTLEEGAVLKTLGGNDQTSNGGTVKIFTSGPPPDLSNATIAAGRLFQGSLDTYLGDLNGDGAITPADAQVAFDAYLNGDPLPPDEYGYRLGDPHRDGIRSPADAQAIFATYLQRAAE